MTAPSCISTNRLRLDGFTEADAPALAAILSVPEVTKNITADGSTPERCLASAHKRIGWHNAAWQRHGYGVWAVRSADTTVAPAGTLLGWCGFAEPDIGADPEILYGLSPSVWGKGIATEAAGRAIAWLFAKTEAKGVSAIIFHRLNAASVHIVQKLGLTRRGTMGLQDFYSGADFARDVLNFERWRLSEGPFRDADALLFEAPYRIGQLTTLGLGISENILYELCAMTLARPEFSGRDKEALQQKIASAFRKGVGETHLEWYHLPRPD